MAIGDPSMQPFSLKDAMIARRQSEIGVPKMHPMHSVGGPRTTPNLYQQSMMDWRAARPTFPSIDFSSFQMPDWRTVRDNGGIANFDFGTINPQVASTIQDYLSGMRDWRTQRPTRHPVLGTTPTGTVPPSPNPAF